MSDIIKQNGKTYECFGKVNTQLEANDFKRKMKKNFNSEVQIIPYMNKYQLYVEKR